MESTRRTCPSHPGETRDARFEFLDDLIELGWGSVPMYLIEREMLANGGVLPPRIDLRCNSSVSAAAAAAAAAGDDFH